MPSEAHASSPRAKGRLTLIGDLLLGSEHDGDKNEPGQQCENRKVLRQALIAGPLGLPVFRVDRAILLTGERFEEAEDLFKINELLFGLPMAGMLLPDHQSKGYGQDEASARKEQPGGSRELADRRDQQEDQ